MLNRVYRLAFEIRKFQPVLHQFVVQQLILRYRRTLFGYLWTLFNPLLMMSVMAVVFSTLFKADLKTFSIFLFSGMIPWNCFNSIVTQSTSSFISNESLIKKIYLPKVLFPLSIAVSLTIESMLSFVAFFIIMLILGADFSWATLFMPFAYLLLFVFALGIGLIVSVITVFFRDLQHVIMILMQGLFFLTPILYKNTALSGKVSWLVQLNPVAPFIDLFRAPLYLTQMPSMNLVVQTASLAFGSLLIGVVLFLCNEHKIVFRL